MSPAAAVNKEKILAVLYSAGKYAKEQPKLLGTIENKLGIKEWLESQGHEYIVTDDKEGPDSEFQKHIKDATCVITTPFHPAYLTRDIMNKAEKLKIAITAGVGSDHIDLNAANERKITVAEVTGSNVVAVAEHVIMTILNLVRNFVPAHEQIMRGEWNVAQVARNSYDVENKVIGTLGAGRIGYRVLERLQPFDPKELLYYDYQALPEAAAKKVGARRVEDLKEFLGQLDILTINAPLHEGTYHLINKETLGYMKPGAWIVNTARGAICDAQAIKDALASGHLNGYGGDVWDQQPAPANHPLRSAINNMGGGNAMTAHISGTSLDSQERYARGVKEILDNYFNNREQTLANLIVIDGQYASKAYGQR
ncbi:NAD-dependent formate dehydrogenase [Wallemia mellicola]|uniref:Formate dehydrogenase n=1 Tax=Wallemia mellicola TaxID=1708541 RepID=A0AB74KJD1_9BASI|nr:NAD-dependent formate dehydrogenase [Wallemia mellicola]